VLDPFTCSGTAGIAAFKVGASFVGYAKKQIDLSRSRLKVTGSEAGFPRSGV
jgi:DNA modification methylase